MSDRTSPYVFGPHMGPDMVAIVAKHPHDCLIHYEGNSYKFLTCCLESCGRKYWRRYSTTGTRLLASTNPTQTYCSDKCAQEKTRVLKAARQKRYQAKRRVRR